ncbi:hypothetical protein LMG23992_04882 [Cupriavidus laharis]|uniref:EamA family transporter n=1 Tax=Cupriavidus laharis TaxID=151654 RepID=A0ABM8XRR8_9BURK|nr:hypothetical protein LMG23992_04882 [Cupriavidus laharis]
MTGSIWFLYFALLGAVTAQAAVSGFRAGHA